MVRERFIEKLHRSVGYEPLGAVWKRSDGSGRWSVVVVDADAFGGLMGSNAAAWRKNFKAWGFATVPKRHTDSEPGAHAQFHLAGFTPSTTADELSRMRRLPRVNVSSNKRRAAPTPTPEPEPASTEDATQ